MTAEAVKRKRGDVREDGMVFWIYAKSYASGERWVTPEKFELLKRLSRDVSRERASTKRADDPDFAAREHKRCREYAASKKAEDPTEYYEQRRRQCHGYRLKRNDNPEKMSAHREYQREYTRRRRAEDPLFLLKCRLRIRIYGALRSAGYTKRSKTFDIVGCSVEELKAHIENKFMADMSWDNRHLWHIDHEIPLASATTEKEILKLCHYTNLQPLWAMDNLKKSDKILN